MKKIFIIIIGLSLLWVGWYVLSPLFINQIVDEEIPISSATSHTEDINNIPVMLAPEIILNQNVVMDEPMMISPQPISEIIGEFSGSDNVHKSSGLLKLISDTDSQYIRFEDFNVTNGPKLLVLLSTEENPIETGNLGEYIKIDNLKGNQGNQNYALGNIDITKYKNVIIYCEPFRVIFATALIQLT